MFKCKYCRREFSTKNALSAHCGKTHKEQLLDESVQMDNGDVLNISLRGLKEMRMNHSGRCDVCGKLETANTRPDCKESPNKLCVDHDHNSKKFRGFLCVQCNRNFGWYDKYKSKIWQHEQFEHL